MPARRTHLIGSIIIGLITGLLIYKSIIYSLIFSLLCGVSSDLPDRIERPTNKFHRGFFHSITFFLFLLIILYYSIQNPVSGLIFGYITHLILDYSLTTHIPII